MGSLVVCFAILSLWMLKEHVYRLLLTRVLKRQLGTSFSSPKAEEVRCFFVPATSYKETRRILALFPKTIRSCVFILDKALQPGWTFLFNTALCAYYFLLWRRRAGFCAMDRLAGGRG